MRKILLFILCISLCSCATFTDNANYYRQAYSQIKKKDYDAAFMKLRALLNDDPHSPYAPRVAFGVAEYYLEINDYQDAAIAFNQYIKDYPKDAGVVFAQLMIYKIATKVAVDKDVSLKESTLIESIRKNIFSKPMFFIFFENRKSFSYHSIFDNVYTAFDYVDKVRVVRNGQLFLELSP